MPHPAIQTVIHVIYPPRCTLCGGLVASDHALCGPCWRDTPVITGLVCDACGVPLPGEHGGSAEHCDACLAYARPWAHGRAALLYRDNGRRLVLALKYGDRHEIVHLASRWMEQSARPLLTENTLIAPVPLHRLRLLRRRFNQSALLAQGLARRTGHATCPDLLLRHKSTPKLDGMGAQTRFATLDSTICVHPRRAHLLQDRDVLLIDDVMTSGATLSACTQACHAAGAARVCILTLARVARDA
jgi:ComF family protein